MPFLILIGLGVMAFSLAMRSSGGSVSTPEYEEQPYAPYIPPTDFSPVSDAGEILSNVFDWNSPEISMPQPENVVIDANQNLIAALAMIRYAEGTADYWGYYRLFGGGYTLELDVHPQVRTYGEFLKKGQQDYTTAAGAYQITYTTYRRIAPKLGITGFSPADQDAIAIELIREAGAYDDVIAGRLDTALRKLSPVWVSLPYANVNQPKRNVQQVAAAFTDAGGVIA